MRYLTQAVSDLEQREVRLLLTLADYAEEHDRPMPIDHLLAASGLEYAELVRRLVYLTRLGLVRVERARPLAESYQSVVLTRKGTLRVVAERAATQTLPMPGVRSRLSPLALKRSRRR